MVFLYAGAVGIAFAITYLLTKLYRRIRMKNYRIPARDISKGHRWCIMNDLFTEPTYCNISGNHILSGALCDSCGICIDEMYIKEANKELPCKELSNKSSIHKHHWIKGNLPLCSKCCVCDDPCGQLPKLCEYRCVWCGRTIHERCFPPSDKICDLGPHRTCIVPPNCVTLKLVGMKGRRKYVVDSVKHPNVKDWSPIIVIANRKSGNGDGDHILQAFRRVLNPAQVIDLAELSPEYGLEWCHILSNTTCRVLVAGGDGTIGWVLNAIEKLKLKVIPAESNESEESDTDSVYSTASSNMDSQPLVVRKPVQCVPQPQVCILPLGTGNDLSRVMGWGDGYTGDVDVLDYLNRMERARAVKLDRWQVEITPAKHFGFRLPKKTMVMNNYASIGVDALVTLNFHKHRESRPSLTGSRIMNKLWYFLFGTKDVLERECKHLDRKIKLELDDKVIDLSDIEGIVVLNIATWGGGVKPWTLGASQNNKLIPEARFDDGLVEVFALYSSFHIAQLQVGLAEPLRLGQAKQVKITLFGGNAPVQVDGEPWEQHPATIAISHRSQATMLANTPE